MTRSTPNIAAFSASHARAAGLSRGFTLVEVMVSIAISLALIIGISQIFALAQKTTGGGTTLVKMNGTGRSIQSQLRQDFQGINIDPNQSPGLVITSYSVAAFRNNTDRVETRDPTYPPDPRLFNSPESGDPALYPVSLAQLPNGPYSTNGRMHRVDRLCMFERGNFHRQTANAPNLISQTTATEAFVWYGHLAVLNDAGVAAWDPDNPQTTSAGGAYLNPGVPTVPTGIKNNNNEYASSWVLGRQAILLTGADNINECMFRPVTAGRVPLSLLDTSFFSSGPAGQPANPLFSSRFDMSLSTSQQCQTTYGLAVNANTWYQQISGLELTTDGLNIQTDQRYVTNLFPTKNNAYQSNPAPYQAHWLSAAAAQTAPVFVRGCTQFIVEFAGNYVTQDQDPNKASATFGAVTGNTPDPSGKLDFIPIRDANGNWTRQIRWYGYPRDTMAVSPTDGTISAGQDGTIDITVGSNFITHDVVPLSVFLQNSPHPAAVPFERNSIAFAGMTSTIIQASGFPFLNPQYANKAKAEYSTPYMCAWDSTTGAASLPKMIRITIAIDEPNGRLNTEQTFEYVFELPGN